MPTEMKLPEVGEGIDVGTVVGVLVKVGDTVEVDQTVLELETDKAVVEVPSSVSGVVERVDVKEGEEVAIGSVVIAVGEGDGTPAADEKAAPESAAPETTDAEPEPEAAPKAAESAPAEPASPAPAPAQSQGQPGLIPAAPSVRRLAREMGVDLKAIQGSGILGRISAEDVKTFASGGMPRQAGAAQAGPAAASQPQLPDFSKWGEVERVAMNGIRKATVRSMTTAWATVPMVTHFDTAHADRFESLRQRYKKDAEARGAKLTPTAMLIKIVAAALKKFPEFNASIDVHTNEIVYKKYVNVGVAVDTDNGLLVPVVKNADQKSMIDLAVELGELAQRARDRKLSPDDMQGGNFSVSNLGGIGGDGFTPIVNPPDVAILGVSRGGIQPVWNPSTETFEPVRTMPLSVTYDHRLIDGALAARFLRWVCEAIEEPFLISLEG